MQHDKCAECGAQRAKVANNGLGMQQVVYDGRSAMRLQQLGQS